MVSMPTPARPEPACDLLGVGIGPANLSLAALAAPVPGLRARFFERSPEFRWHPGLLDGRALIQTSYLKDLVTPVDPTSRYSFLAFLRDTGRLYRFLVVDAAHVSRVEFEQYYRWVARQLPALRFGAAVESVDFEGGMFAVRAGARTVRARSLVLGTGRAPRLPDFAEPLLGPDVLHVSGYDLAAPRVAGRRVLVVGGGQSGAELFARLIETEPGSAPAAVTWLSARPNFSPLDDTPFTNELFFPGYVEHFRSLPDGARRTALAQQVLASDGIDTGTLERIYRRLYVLDFLAEPALPYRLLPGHRLTGLSRRPGGLAAAVEAAGGGRESLAVDVVVLCTGFGYRRPAFLDPIADRIHGDGDYRVRADFSIGWDGPPDRRIYVQNAARHSHGVADPNLSLAAWRSAVIVNSAVGRPVYDTAPDSGAIRWPAPAVPALPAAEDPIEEVAR
jgi:lysine N6-hydroxylase